ncbi:LuxR C-terminal-related transcriptional regulator [Dictyobacter aurantiacus]|uniref:LuxR family transcriptional regulator n=1 Tax=Dictyobacter aurantiacus TaxID=1936993 RepID=A0A401ZKE2_9CHLR|nr:LuxR C-terminal-related transcriptional regulator [Dictyobacter aurantiacus]GCE07331.1 LuxR family transcriptional regulator [Dictyobacter aurantiacus]
MPRRASYLLLWSVQERRYMLTTTGAGRDLREDVVPGETSWFAWLEGITSFAFHGQSAAHCTVRKEAVQGNGFYWYAYRSLQRRTVKRYLGRTRELSLAHLEQVAESFNAPAQQATVAPAPIDQGLQTLPTSSTPVSPLLQSKLQPPRLSQLLIERPRLQERLDGWRDYKLTQIVAPAGTGKTTLVKSWLDQRTLSPQISWVSLDAGDNDPIRFWRYILTACLPWSDASSGQQALPLLMTTIQPSLQPVALEKVLTLFLNHIDQQEQHYLLILEDYHVLNTPHIHESLAFLLAHLPQRLHVLLISRQEPPIGLSRLRANGELNELQAGELRFTDDEMEAFLHRALPVPLAPAVLERLAAQLDGWAAGLRLLSLSLQGKKTIEQIEPVLANFRGSQPSIHQYFVGEVWQDQSDVVQDFLLRTSVLTRLSPSLCEAVTGRSDSAALLTTIEQANLFLEALDGEWYRYHGLFAEAMQHEARRRLDAATMQELYLAAAHWFMEHGLLDEAVEAMLQTADSEQVALLLERHLETLRFIEPPELHTWRSWFERLPQPVLKRHPFLCFSYAVALIFDQDRQQQPSPPSAQVELFLQLAEQEWQRQQNQAGLGRVLAIRALWSGKRSIARAQALQALEWLTDEDALWRNLCFTVLGMDAIQMGQVKEAVHAIVQARAYWDRSNNTDARDGMAMMLGLLYNEMGDLKQAAFYYRQLIADASHSDQHPVAIFAHLGLAFLYYEWNMPDEAGRQIRAGSSQPEPADDMLQDIHASVLELLQALLQYGRGETRAALQRLTDHLLEHRSTMATSSNPFYTHVYQELIGWIVRLSLLLGDYATAQTWLDDLTQHYQHTLAGSDMLLLEAPSEAAIVDSAASRIDEQPWHQDRQPLLILQENKAMLEARLYLAQGQTEVALHILSSLLPTAHEAGRGRHTLQIRLLMAQIYMARKQSVEAREMLLNALKQGYAGGYQRLILDEGDQLFLLVRDLLPQVPGEPLRSYAQSLLRAFARSRQQVTVTLSTIFEPLSKQEQKVLRLLISGRSNPEIARELIVSVNTVRTQIQSIYRKLQVNNRQAASAVARELNLL